ncbi:ribosomal large subunit pseudouridine synthase D [Marininema mesophilum]|uniref:Pseudouridine synthase n=1 Tax=Marininema mesophilum TaxID=1048340 RepID=A0A1H2QBI6_9BACL|nr:RluA family pseudouridine synthase [Marininema mesophilum]SDW04617.1 ribosomal large subunit pseudouridine synthase D [Marininema mesophilum]
MSDTENLHAFHVDESEAGERLDKFLANREDDWSRMAVQAWIKDNRVLVDGQHVKSNYRLAVGEHIEVAVPPPEELHIEAEAIPLEIVYEDDDVIVVNKERGMVVHPAPGNYSGTMVNALLYHCDDLSSVGGVIRPGIVHRIDKDTSGLIMATKNDVAHWSLAEQLKEHTVERVYETLVIGNLPHDHGTIDAAIGRDPKNRQRMAVDPKKGKHAITHFEVVERFGKATLVRCCLETGRTHQIRVHMKYIGHPIVGDPVYSTQVKKWPINGQALHAKVLGFLHPRTGDKLRFVSEVPEDMKACLVRLRQQ